MARLPVQVRGPAALPQQVATRMDTYKNTWVERGWANWDLAIEQAKFDYEAAADRLKAERDYRDTLTRGIAELERQKAFKSSQLANLGRLELRELSSTARKEYDKRTQAELKQYGFENQRDRDVFLEKGRAERARIYAEGQLGAAATGAGISTKDIPTLPAASRAGKALSTVTSQQTDEAIADLLIAFSQNKTADPDTPNDLPNAIIQLAIDRGEITFEDLASGIESPATKKLLALADAGLEKAKNRPRIVNGVVQKDKEGNVLPEAPDISNIEGGLKERLRTNVASYETDLKGAAAARREAQARITSGAQASSARVSGGYRVGEAPEPGRVNNAAGFVDARQVDAIKEAMDLASEFEMMVAEFTSKYQNGDVEGYKKGLLENKDSPFFGMQNVIDDGNSYLAIGTDPYQVARSLVEKTAAGAERIRLTEEIAESDKTIAEFKDREVKLAERLDQLGVSAEEKADIIARAREIYSQKFPGFSMSGARQRKEEQQVPTLKEVSDDPRKRAAILAAKMSDTMAKYNSVSSKYSAKETMPEQAAEIKKQYQTLFENPVYGTVRDMFNVPFDSKYTPQTIKDEISRVYAGDDLITAMASFAFINKNKQG
jgi:hypothetical protein